MKAKTWDAVLLVKLLSTDAGGRRSPTAAHMFNCLMQIGGRNLDVRLHLDEVGPLSPGQQAIVPASFLDPDLAKDYCSVGDNFVLREARQIGDGVVEKTNF